MAEENSTPFNSQKHQAMKDGTETKAIYIKHLSLEDWETLGQIRAALGGKSVAEAIRWAVRKAGGKL